MSPDQHHKPSYSGDHGPFIRHDDTISAVEYSPDRKYVATGGADNAVYVWDVSSKEMVFYWVAQAEVRSLSFSPDGMLLAGTMSKTRGKAKTFILHLRRQKRIFCCEHRHKAKFTDHSQEYGHKSSAYFQRFSPDGKCLVFGSATSCGRVMLDMNQPVRSSMRIWDLIEQGRLETILPFTADGRYARFVYRTRSDSYLRMCAIEMQTGITSHIDLALGPFDHFAPVCSPDGRRVAGAVPRGKGFQICDAYTGKVLAGPFFDHPDFINGLCFSPDGDHIVDCSEDGSFIVWNAHTGEKVLAPLMPFLIDIGPITGIQYSPDGKSIVTIYHDSLAMWDATSSEILSGPPVLFEVTDCEDKPLIHEGPVFSVQWSPDGQRLYSSAGTDNYIRIHNTQTGKLIDKFVFQGGACITLSPDGTMLAAGSARRMGPIKILDAHTGKSLNGGQPLILTSKGKHNWYDGTKRLAISPDGSTLAVVCMNGTFHLVRLEKGYEDDPFDPPMKVLDATFHPDGRRLCCISASRGVYIYDNDSKEMTGMVHDCASISFAPDGRHYIGYFEHEDSDYNTQPRLTVRNISTDEDVFQFPTEIQLPAVWSPDGTRILHGTVPNRGKPGRMQMIDAFTSEVIWQSSSPVKSLVVVEFSPDGLRFATGEADGSVKIWDAYTGNQLLPEPIHKGRRDSQETELISIEREVSSSRRGFFSDFDDDAMITLPLIPKPAPKPAVEKSTVKTSSDAGGDGSHGQGMSEQSSSRVRHSKLAARLKERMKSRTNPTAQSDSNQYRMSVRRRPLPTLVSPCKKKSFNISTSGRQMRPIFEDDTYSMTEDTTAAVGDSNDEDSDVDHDYEMDVVPKGAMKGFCCPILR